MSPLSENVPSNGGARRLFGLGLLYEDGTATPRYLELLRFAAWQLSSRRMDPKRAKDILQILVWKILQRHKDYIDHPPEPATYKWLRNKVRNIVRAVNLLMAERTLELTEVIENTAPGARVEDFTSQIEVYDLIENFLATLPGQLDRVFDAWHLHPDTTLMAECLAITVEDLKSRLRKLMRLGKKFLASQNSPKPRGGRNGR